jgi:hypothetical protein
VLHTYTVLHLQSDGIVKVCVGRIKHSITTMLGDVTHCAMRSIYGLAVMGDQLIVRRDCVAGSEV